MKLTWIILMFQITPTFCNKRGEELQALLSSTFNYDFRSFPDIGDIIVWKISGNPKKVSEPKVYTTHIPELLSNKTYLIFTRITTQYFSIYYWVGEMASLTDKKAAARYALLQNILFDDYLDTLDEEFTTLIIREEEYIESESFWNTINCTNRISATEVLHKQYTYVDEYLPSRLPNLYIVKGTNTTARVKEVPLSIKWLKNDICLLLETGYVIVGWAPIMTYCGPNASSMVQERTKTFALIFGTYYKYMANSVREPLHRDSFLFKALLEVLEDSNHFNPYEIDNSQDQLKDADAFVVDRDNDVSLHRIYNERIQRITLKRADTFQRYGFNSETDSSPLCHLFDSASIAGLFLFLNYEEEQEVQLKVIEMVEDYIHNNHALASRPIRMRIMGHWGPVCFTYQINLIDWPNKRDFYSHNVGIPLIIPTQPMCGVFFN